MSRLVLTFTVTIITPRIGTDKWGQKSLEPDQMLQNTVFDQGLWSVLFATHPVFLRQSRGRKMDLLKF